MRERFPGMPILVGGAHPTAAWESVLRETAADLCVVGEGEAAFCDVVAHYAGCGKPLDEIPGLAFRRDGAPFRTARRPPIPNLDSIPFPAWDLVDFAKYKGMHLKCAEPQTYIAVSRGCPFDRWFCSHPIWKESKPWVRLRRPWSIAQEVEQLYRRGIREVYLSADEFNVNCEWPVAVARELKKMNVWMVHIGVER